VLFVTAGIYLVPAFYTPSMLAQLPWPLRGAITSNPISVYLDLFRDCLLASRPARLSSWLAAGVIAVVLPAAGRRVFNRLRMFFGNFL
jgi:ABC-type polysaccharide/polyol phosphate export permease